MSDHLRRSIVILTLWFLGVLRVVAQEPARPRIETRLLEILHQNKVITDAQHAELTGLAADMRREEEALAADQVEFQDSVERLREMLPKEPASAQYRTGRGFLFRSANGNHALSIGGRLQTRFTYNFWEKNPDTDGEYRPDFNVQRARLNFTGHAFDPDLRFRIGMDAGGERAETTVNFLGIIDTFESSNDLVELKDAYLEWDRWEAFKIRFGQFKTPTSRHGLSSVGDQQFVDRAVTDRVFGPGRNVGVMLSGNALGKDDDILEWSLGVFDGEGENRTNDDKGLMYAGRLAVHPFGECEDFEGDLDHSDEFRLALGISGRIHQDDGHVDGGDDWTVAIDLAARYAGWFFLGEAHYLEIDATALDDPNATGGFLQLGYAIVPHEWDIAVRAAMIDWDNNERRNSAAREYLVVVGWYGAGHDLKVQMDFGWIEDHEGNHDDNREGYRLRLQVTVAF